MTDVTQRLDVTYESLYTWVQYGKPNSTLEAEDAQQAEIRKLKTALRRATEERDILKEARCTSPWSQRKVHVHKITIQSIHRYHNVQSFGASPQRFLRMAATTTELAC
jgi:transposase